MHQPVVNTSSRMEQWLSSVSAMRAPTVITCDFDGTLVPRYASDESHFSHIAAKSQPDIARLLANPERIGGVCTSRSIFEVRRILEGGFVDGTGRSLSGLSAAENGAVVFCSRLSPHQEEKLSAAGFVVDRSIADLTVINLAKVDPNRLRDSVVLPAVAEVKIAPESWSSSVGQNHDRETFLRLFEMSKHFSPERTEQACVRFGSAYVKVYDTADGKGQELIKSLQRHATSAGVLCLVTPPLDGHPIWTADLGGGVTKYDAMKSICDIYGVLSGLPDHALTVLYFGDGENDLPAFQYISERQGTSRAFLVDTPHGNEERSSRVAPGTQFLRGFYDLAGVVEGVRRHS